MTNRHIVVIMDNGRMMIDENSDMITGYSKVYPWSLLLTEFPELSWAIIAYVTFVPTGNEGIMPFHMSSSRLVMLMEVAHVSVLLEQVTFRIICSSGFRCVIVALTLTVSVYSTSLLGGL